MRVQHNITAMNSYRNYNNNTKQINKNLEKLSSGYKINRAGDDAAGLAISEKMRAQITGLDVAQKNAKDGISLVQTAEGALTEVHSMLNRMFELAEQSANGTYDDGVDRTQLQKEVEQLKKEINRIADSSNFNGTKLLDGSLGGWTNTQTIATTALYDSITVSGGKLTEGDSLTFEHGTTGQVKLKDGTIKLGGKSLTIASNKFATTDGLTIEATGGPGINGASGTNGDPGTYTFKITVSDEKKATQDVAKAVGDGLTISIHTTGKPASAAEDVKFATDGTGGGLTLQIGDTADDYNQLNVTVSDIHTSALLIDNIDISQQGSAQTAMDAIKTAINTVSDVRGTLGASQNRLEHTINNLSVMKENIQDAESTIRDTDVADEMMKYTKNSILVQSAQAMLAQANQQPQGVLQLLQ